MPQPAQPVATPPADAGNVRLNNRVRGMLDAALGSLTLMAKEPGRRFDAAQAVFKSRDAGALANIDKALEKETDARVRKALTEARAAVVLSSAETSPEDKIAAIAVIRDRGDQDALGLIDSLPADLPPAVRQAASSAAARSAAILRSGARCRTPGTGFRSAPSCCLRRSALPSPSASWASSTWRTARW